MRLQCISIVKKWTCNNAPTTYNWLKVLSKDYNFNRSSLGVFKGSCRPIFFLDSCNVSKKFKFKTLTNILGFYSTLMQHPPSITWYILGRKVAQAPHKFKPWCVLWVGLPMAHLGKILFSIFTNYLFSCSEKWFHFELFACEFVPIPSRTPMPSFFVGVKKHTLNLHFSAKLRIDSQYHLTNIRVFQHGGICYHCIVN